MQQEQLDRVVPGAESGALRTDRTVKVRDTESAERIEAKGAPGVPGTWDEGDPVQNHYGI